MKHEVALQSKHGVTSIRIGFLIAALNGLDVLAGDIGNAYINAPCKEKIWTIAGYEFGSDQGQVMLIV